MKLGEGPYRLNIWLNLRDGKVSESVEILWIYGIFLQCEMNPGLRYGILS